MATSLTQATAGMTGCIDFQLSSLGAAAREVVSRAANETVVQLRRNPHLLSARFLSTLQLGGGASFQSDVNVDEIAKLNSSLQLLLSGPRQRTQLTDLTGSLWSR